MSAQNSWERKYLKIYDETHDELTNLIRHRNVALCFTISVKLPCDSLVTGATSRLSCGCPAKTLAFICEHRGTREIAVLTSSVKQSHDR